MPPAPGGRPLSLSVVLPALNEEQNLRLGLVSMVEVLEALVPRWEIVVVDDGSRDGTARVLESEGRRDPRVRAIHHRVNQGYGAALRSGFLAARHELIFFTDADLQFDLRELGSLLALAGRVDIVAGYRHPRRDPWNRRLNAWAWGRLVNGLFDLGIADVNCAFKLFHRRVLDSIDIRSCGAFVNTEILAQARAAGFTLAQVPVSHYPRLHGEQTGARPAVVLRAFIDLARLYKAVAIAPALTAEPRFIEPLGSAEASAFFKGSVNQAKRSCL